VAASICERRSSSSATTSAVGSNGSAIARPLERQRGEHPRVGLGDQRRPPWRARAVECGEPGEPELVA
jgi:hypothetical protein